MKTTLSLVLVFVSSSAMASITLNATQNAVQEAQLRAQSIRSVRAANATCGQIHDALAATNGEIGAAKYALTIANEAVAKLKAAGTATAEQMAEIEKKQKETSDAINAKEAAIDGVFSQFITICGLTKDDCTQRLNDAKTSEKNAGEELVKIAVKAKQAQTEEEKNALNEQFEAKMKQIDTDAKALQAACVDVSKEVQSN